MEKIVRTEAYKLADAELQAKLEENSLNFQEELQTINEVEELKKLEDELMLDFDEYDAYIKKVRYSLPGEVEYNGNKMTAKDIKKSIVYLLNQIEVDFRSTLGVYQAIRYWKEVKDNDIDYAPYETTLRLLGTLKYKGESSFLEILIINNWFASAHEAYKKDVIWHGYLSSLHNDILKRMDELTKVTEENVNE